MVYYKYPEAVAGAAMKSDSEDNDYQIVNQL